MPELNEQIKNRINKADATLPKEDYPFPLYVIVEPTNICNLRCVMCPSPKQTRPRGIMAMALWRKIMDEVSEKSPNSLIWPAIMGEGLTAGEQFLDMLEYAGLKRLKVIWNTNAVLLNDAWIDKIMKLDLREIIVGLDAATEDTYKIIRVKGDFSAAVANTLKLIERNNKKTRITVQFIEQDANTHEKDAFKLFWLAKGAVVKIRPRLGWGNAVETPALTLSQTERVGPCPWIIRTVSIHWNGVVAQCDGDWNQKWPAGNLNNQTLEEIWKGELASRRRRHRRMDFDFDPCKNCTDWQAGLSEFRYPPDAVYHWQRERKNYFVDNEE